MLDMRTRLDLSMPFPHMRDGNWFYNVSGSGVLATAKTQITMNLRLIGFSVYFLGAQLTYLLGVVISKVQVVQSRQSAGSDPSQS
jgi:hypothetical protein